MSRILITGGCGYIGSHTAIDLLDHGYEVVSLDNLCNSTLKTIDRIEKVTGQVIKNYDIDLRDEKAVESFFTGIGHIDGIIHFAALKSVSQSVQQPLRYYDNNVKGMMNLVQSTIKYGIDKFVFSSSCTVYGEVSDIPVHEDTPLGPAISPYGSTKKISEQLLNDLAKAKKLRSISLRYFNPAGAHDSGLIGEDAAIASVNLVPIINEVAGRKRKFVEIYGTDYPTPDGTCIRDYVHVMDLAGAHRLAFERLNAHENIWHDIFNLGLGKGVSVLEAIEAFEVANEIKVQTKLAPRRPGDISAIYANANKANQLLAWYPMKDIQDIMRTAWKWEQHR